MRTLADIQAGIRDALMDGNGAAVAPVLVGGSRPAQRLAIHQRHYVASSRARSSSNSRLLRHGRSQSGIPTSSLPIPFEAPQAD